MDYGIFYGSSENIALRGTARGITSTVAAATNIATATAATASNVASNVMKTAVVGGSGYMYRLLPEETSPLVWQAMFGIAGGVIFFGGYRMLKWVSKIDTNTNDSSNFYSKLSSGMYRSFAGMVTMVGNGLERTLDYSLGLGFLFGGGGRKDKSSELYEYKYLSDLDEMLQTKLDDMENPEMAEVDTIRVGKSIYPLEVFRSFTRNYRKRLLRKTDKTPIVKRIAIPAEEFDWKRSFVEEIVPPQDKKLMMRYEPETDSFWWYSDSSSVQYKYLETVARKYVCDFNRLDVFIDIRDELKKGVEDAKKRNGDGDGSGDGGDGGSGSGKGSLSENERKVYAKFKRYNKKAARVDPTLGNKKMIIKAKANRYSYKGKLIDYDEYIQKANENDNANTSTPGNGSENGIDSDADANKKHDFEHISWRDWKIGRFEGWR